MNCAEATHNLGFTCHPISEKMVYIESPLTLAFDGSMIGAYVLDLGSDRVRIFDNADTLFSAMTYGIAPNVSRGRKLQALAESCGLHLSSEGELHVSCGSNEVGYYLARFVEAADRISHVCDGYRPAPVSKFERVVGSALKDQFRDRIKRDVKVAGASGHQLGFPFVLDFAQPGATYIQIVASPDGQPSWSSIYQTVGKLMDLRNAIRDSRRVVILEDALADQRQQAITALAEAASVITYESPGQLAQALAA